LLLLLLLDAVWHEMVLVTTQRWRQPKPKVLAHQCDMSVPAAARMGSVNAPGQSCTAAASTTHRNPTFRCKQQLLLSREMHVHVLLPALLCNVS
jgi:hypothetical protein